MLLLQSWLPGRAQASAPAPVVTAQGAAQAAGQGAGKGTPQSAGQGAAQGAGMGSKDSPGGTGQSGKDGTSASRPAGSAEELAASTTKLRLAPTAPAAPPADLPKTRPVIGLALGGGAAIALAEIGSIEWLEEHHIPVDVIAGTSMGSILAALYSTGHTPEQMHHILTGEEVSRVFRIGANYSALSYRRREEDRDLPNGIGIGLRHGVSFRNSVLTDTGLNELLDKEFLSYNDQTDFNNLPIPFRCQATDLTAARSVTFARGSLPDALRASASIPGVFRPFELAGHEYVDGAILENLPTPEVRGMKADVVIAISLPLEPVGTGDLGSILGVLQRAFAVGIENNEARDRKLANVVIMPEVKGFTANDYLKVDLLAKRGYDAAEAHKPELLQYALNDTDWAAYLAHRRAKERPPAGAVLQVKVTAPNPGLTEYVQHIFQPLGGQPVETEKVETLLAELRADGRYEADYTVGYDGVLSNRPILLVSVDDKKSGPPFLDIGANIAAQTAGVTRATLSTVLLWQDLGGYGSGVRVLLEAESLLRLLSGAARQPHPRAVLHLPGQLPAVGAAKPVYGGRFRRRVERQPVRRIPRGLELPACFLVSDDGDGQSAQLRRQLPDGAGPVCVRQPESCAGAAGRDPFCDVDRLPVRHTGESDGTAAAEPV